MEIDGFINTGTDFYKKEDFPQPQLLTISGATVETMGDDEKLVLQFAEGEKGLACNKTNLQLLAVFYGSNDTDDWRGKQVVLFNEPTIVYAGKVVGGIRVRLPKGVEPAGASKPDFDDDVPF